MTAVLLAAKGKTICSRECSYWTVTFRFRDTASASAARTAVTATATVTVAAVRGRGRGAFVVFFDKLFVVLCQCFEMK